MNSIEKIKSIFKSVDDIVFRNNDIVYSQDFGEGSHISVILVTKHTGYFNYNCDYTGEYATSGQHAYTMKGIMYEHLKEGLDEDYTHKMQNSMFRLVIIPARNVQYIKEHMDELNQYLKEKLKGSDVECQYSIYGKRDGKDVIKIHINIDQIDNDELVSD